MFITIIEEVRKTYHSGITLLLRQEKGRALIPDYNRDGVPQQSGECPDKWHLIRHVSGATLPHPQENPPFHSQKATRKYVPKK